MAPACGTNVESTAQGWKAMLRYVVLMGAAIALAGCADDVVMRNGLTGKTETCEDILRGFNPWSQTMACVANHEAQGWTRSN
jgi:hypothetical protein